MGTVIALVAAAIYVKAFLPPVEERDGAALFAIGFWAVAIFGIVSALLGGDFGPLAAAMGWSRGVE